MNDETSYWTISEAATRLRSGDVSATELVDHALQRINRFNPTLNCFIEVLYVRAHEQAIAIDKLFQSGVDLGPLQGIPVSLKDNIATAGVRTSAGSSLLSNWIPDEDADVVHQLSKSGAVIVGKATMYEFAFGAENARFGVTRNPWDTSRTTAGSSSGSAASVAAGLSFGSVGTDSGGSVRHPAAFCGIVGFKPTYGAVSCRGVIPLSNSLDHVGPLARTVTDVALMYAAMVGMPRSIENRLMRALEGGLKGIKIGCLPLDSLEGVDAEVKDHVNAAYELLEREGAELIHVGFPSLTAVGAVLWTIMLVEAAEYHRNNLKRFSSEFHPFVRDRLERGQRIPGTFYVQAQRLRRKIGLITNTALQECDVLAMPSVPTLPHSIHVSAEVSSRYSGLANLTGQPAVVVPCGFSVGGLPIGFELAGRSYDDETVLRVARAYERATGWHQIHPTDVATAAS